MFKWPFMISDNCLPVAVQTVSSSVPLVSKSLTLTFGDLLEAVETVAAVPTQRDLDLELELDTVAKVASLFIPFLFEQVNFLISIL